ncbi:polymer-forming cytoskeletal protein [Candidatus Contubernalis alkaliaceticus]|uniref:polymer-forming cytoskeletal protein n=1 Tax=Candidatus Contubernalis alkaliaceticus TaxID=338645 RepID=UPI001F4C3B00|nr:polymer-forming cytoskeletal protein [Candidatus Contubernalis alkalaceticus]UNC91398.1 polymer-forming cytoskeletal protein [Candidatus Contubernalis alkalaceticus]
MRKSYGKWVCLVLLAVLLLTGTAAGQGTVINEDINKTTGSLEIPRNTTVNGDVTVNMGEIEIDGIVNGDVINNMGKVSVFGDINGSVTANMGEVVIPGRVSGNVDAKMGSVSVDGDVGGNLKAGLGSIKIRGTIAGDVDLELGDLQIIGHVLGNVNSQGKIIRITGQVDGDVTMPQGIVELGPNAVVGGRVLVEQGLVQTDAGAQVGSIIVNEELSRREVDNMFSGGYNFRGIDDFINILPFTDGEFFRNFNFNLRPGHHRFFPFYTPFTGWTGRAASRILGMVVIFALAALVHTLFPRNTKNIVQAVNQKTGPAILWGVLTVILAIPLVILLAITIIGIPLILVEFLLLAIAWLMGYTGVALWLGGRVLKSSSTVGANPLGELALGVLLLGIIGFIPVLGGLVGIGVFILAVGAALSTRFGTENLNNDGEFPVSPTNLNKKLPEPETEENTRLENIEFIENEDNQGNSNSIGAERSEQNDKEKFD